MQKYFFWKILFYKNNFWNIFLQKYFFEKYFIGFFLFFLLFCSNYFEKSTHIFRNSNKFK